VTLTVSVDDVGLAARSTAHILGECTGDALDRVGILPNGEAFELAVEALRRRDCPAWAVHLNLAEGAALSPRELIPLLVDARGCFRRSFLGMWLLHALSRRRRQALRAQVEVELEAQVRRVAEALPQRPIAVDSHRHFHLQPFIFRILVRRADAWGIRCIRTAKEPLVAPPLTRGGLAAFLGANLLKHAVLRLFSCWCLRALAGSKLTHPDYLVGVLFSGRMSLAAVRRSVGRIARQSGSGDARVELVFHPAGADCREMRSWGARRSARRFYASPGRAAEMQVLVSQELRRFLARARESRC
jgi:predicted glycoside hydrolase/deacetylase ChbG (UPF0249 family)